MSVQTTLTEDAPMILDATCSTKTRESFCRCASIRMDVRAEVKPDLVADARFLPFRDGVFDRIFCDPPHIISPKTWEVPSVSRWFSSVNRNRADMLHANYANNMRRFGHWKTREEWMDFVAKTADEFPRCLKPSGVLEYKIAELRSKSTRLADLNPLLKKFVIAKERKWGSRWGKNPTYWLTMKPKPTRSEST